MFYTLVTLRQSISDRLLGGLDTNVVVSANLKTEGLEALVLDLAISGKLSLCVSPPVLAEYEDVLRRPKFKLSPERIEAVLRLLRQRSLLMTALPALAQCRHEPDNRFLECAQAAKAHFLVTGNTRHFPARWPSTRIVNCRQFLTLVGATLLGQEY
mgnify:CR=1 FL=1